MRQNEEAAAGKKADLQALVSKGQSWMVTKEPHVI
jgi:2-oxoglutarate ferredoxin oxidoreductase subunit beta